MTEHEWKETKDAGDGYVVMKCSNCNLIATKYINYDGVFSKASLVGIFGSCEEYIIKNIIE